MPRPQRKLGVLVALREEMRAIEPGLRGFGVALGRMGMGRASAWRKTGEFLDAAQPAVLVVCGFGGGLRPDLTPGDVVIATDVIEPAEPTKLWHPPVELLTRATTATATLQLHHGRIDCGRLVTVARVLASSADKARVRNELAADIVDMESAGALEAAATRGVPVLCVRVVLDEHDFELPFDFGKILTAAGRPRILETLKAVVSNPAGLTQLLPLRERAVAAARSLGEFVPRLLEGLS